MTQPTLTEIENELNAADFAYDTDDTQFSDLDSKPAISLDDFRAMPSATDAQYRAKRNAYTQLTDAQRAELAAERAAELARIAATLTPSPDDCF